MTHKPIACLLIPFLLFAVCSVPAASAKTLEERRALQAEKVREAVSELGVGQDSVVKVRLRDHQKLTGYTSAIGEESFVVTDFEGTTTSVPYANVAQMSGRNLTTEQKIGIGVAIAAVVIAVIAIAVYKSHCPGSIGC
jgi:hypothetical protein